MNTAVSISSRFNLTDKKYIASRIACIAFILAFGLYLWGGRPFVASIISLSAILLFAIQFLFQFNAVNGALGGLMFLVGFYFALAVWYEFSEFEEVNKEALNLLLVGWGFCLAAVVLAVLMIIGSVRDFAD